MIDDNYDPYRWTAGLVAFLSIVIIIIISVISIFEKF